MTKHELINGIKSSIDRHERIYGQLMIKVSNVKGKDKKHYKSRVNQEIAHITELKTIVEGLEALE